MLKLACETFRDERLGPKDPPCKWILGSKQFVSRLMAQSCPLHAMVENDEMAGERWVKNFFAYLTAGFLVIYGSSQTYADSGLGLRRPRGDQERQGACWTAKKGTPVYSAAARIHSLQPLNPALPLSTLNLPWDVLGMSLMLTSLLLRSIWTGHLDICCGVQEQYTICNAVRT